MIRYTSDIHKQLQNRLVISGQLLWILPNLATWIIMGFLFPASKFGDIQNLLSGRFFISIVLIFLSVSLMMVLSSPNLAKIIKIQKQPSGTGIELNPEIQSHGKTNRAGLTVEQKAHKELLKMPQHLLWSFPIIMGTQIWIFSELITDELFSAYMLLGISLTLVFFTLIYLFDEFVVGKFSKYFDYQLEIQGVSIAKKLGLSSVILIFFMSSATGVVYNHISNQQDGMFFSLGFVLPLTGLLIYVLLNATARPVMQILKTFRRFNAKKENKTLKDSKIDSQDNPKINSRDNTKMNSQNNSQSDIQNVEIECADEFGELTFRFNSLLVEQASTQMEYNRQISLKLATSAEELSSSSEEVSVSSENIAKTQQQIAKSVANELAEIKMSQQKIHGLSEGMQTIQKRIAEINELSAVISNIANQTNMLALNAAIEAARAGEAGRGFNVVADQVRKLADESKKAANRTDVLIKDIQAIITLQKQNTEETLHSIEIVGMNSESNSASTEEAASAAEEQASSMEQISSTAQTLQLLAEELKKALLIKSVLKQQ